MRYRLLDIPAMLATPLGRMQLLDSPVQLIGPLLVRLAGIHRRSVVNKTRIAAVVGSFGKTTTARCLHVALGGDIEKLSLRNSGTFLAHLLLRIRPGDRHSVIEVGLDRPGQMRGYAEMIRPDITVVTSIGSEHHRSFGTLDVTRSEKSEMVRVLPETGLAVLNGDDPNVRWIADKTRARVVTFGLRESNDVFATDISMDWPRGTRLRLHAGNQTRDMHVRLVGRHMVYPVLAAAAAALAEGISLDELAPRIERVAPVPGRLEPVRLEGGAIILRDDCKSTLETIHSALDVFSEVPARRKIVILGEVSEPPGSMGPIYRDIGRRIAEVASRAVFFGGNFQRYAAGAVRAGLARSELIDAGKSPAKAVEAVQGDLGPGVVVLVKGRDNERLGRIALALAGRTVRCDIGFCDIYNTKGCQGCPMLERGWEGRRFVLKKRFLRPPRPSIG